MRIILNSKFWLTVAMFISFMNVAVGSVYNRRDSESTVASAQDMDTARNHDLAVDRWDETACQIVWSGADATDATMAVYASIDGTNFELIAGSSYTLGAASGNHVWQIAAEALLELRFAYAKGTNTAGTYALYCRREVPKGGEQ